MADGLTHADRVQIARLTLEAGNSLIDPDRVDVEGHPLWIIVHTVAAMGDELQHDLTRLEANLFLDTATGDDLERLVFDRMGITKNGAAPSVGEVAFSRPTAGAGAITVRSGEVLVSTDGTRFVTTEDAIFGAVALGPITVEVRSETAGAGQAALAGEITAFADTFTDDSSITVTNAAATAGDADAETDEELRDRARKYFENARRGTLAAIEYGALTVAGVKFAVATEVTTSSGQPARWVKLQVADRNGNATAALASLVEAALEEWRCAGMRVQVIAASVTYVEITLALTIDSDFDDNAVADAVRAAVVAELALFDPGQTLYHSDIIKAAKAVEGVVDVSVTDPVAALAPDDGEVFRTKTELITITSP